MRHNGDWRGTRERGEGTERDAEGLGGWGIGGIPLDLVGGLVAWSWIYVWM
jgi:hypothetical protein